MGLFSSSKNEDLKFKEEIIGKARKKAQISKSENDLQNLFSKTIDLLKVLKKEVGYWEGLTHARNQPSHLIWKSVYADIRMFWVRLTLKKNEVEDSDILKSYILLDLYNILNEWVESGIIENRIEMLKLLAMYYSEIVTMTRLAHSKGIYELRFH